MRPTVRLVVAVAVAGLLVGAWPVGAANDGGASLLWNMRLVGAEAAWSTGTGRNITIAVVDTGVHLTHEDLAGKVVPGRNLVTEGASAQDDNGHGTHVAGIAGAVANNRIGVFGVAPDVRIMPVRVLHGPNGTGFSEDVDAGIRWAADNGAHVINLSLGEDLQGLPLMGPSFVDAVEYAFEKGAICVVAAGNSALKSSGFTKNTNALVVTATTKEDEQATYASDVGAIVGGTPKWSLAAPGGAGGKPDEDDIISTYWTSSGATDQYAWAAGTSMAAPHVAGAVAILRGLGLSAGQAADRLTATAKDLGNAGPDNRFGYGRLDVAKAVAGLAPAGGGGTGTGGGAAVTTTTTTTSARRSGGSSGTTTTAAAGGNRTRSPSTADTIPGPDVTQASPDETPVPDAVDGDDLRALGEAAESGDGRDGNDPVWPLGVPAALALVAAGVATARARRLRV